MADSSLGWYSFNPSSAQNPDFAVVAIEGVEKLGDAYYFDLDLVSSSSQLDLSELLGRPSALAFKPWGAVGRYFHGHVTRAQALRETNEGKFLYRLRLEPMLTRLRSTVQTKSYLDLANGLTIKELLTEVLDQQGFSALAQYEFSLRDPHRRRPFMMQYQESDWNFLMRWLEFEGAYFYFDQGDENGVEKVVFLDDIAAFTVAELPLQYMPPGMIKSDQYLSSLLYFSESVVPVSQSVHLKNFNYRTAQRSVTGSAVVDGAAGWGTIYQFGGDFRTNFEADLYSQYRAESVAAQSSMFNGRTLASGLTLGGLIVVSGHPRDSLNGRYRVTAIRHRGSQSGFGLETPAIDGLVHDENYYIAEFEAIPADTPYRLPMRTAKPKISGYLPALIDATESDSPDLDQLGRYKVDLIFDAVERESMTGSPRIRLAAPYHSQGRSGDTGFHYPLFKGTEVMLMFMDGDPDQPVICGTLTNSLNPSPVTQSNPKINRIVSQMGHEIQMDDNEETQGIRMQSSGKTAALFIGQFGGKVGIE